MKRTLLLLATTLAFSVPTHSADGTEKKVIAKGSVSNGGDHSDADASYSIVRVGDNVDVAFSSHFASVQNKGGGKGGFRFILRDSKGSILVDWHQTHTIGRNNLKGKEHRRDTKKITLIGQQAADFVKNGGSAQMVALVDREGNALPTSSKELKDLYKSLTGSEWGSEEDTKKKGMLIRSIVAGA